MVLDREMVNQAQLAGWESRAPAQTITRSTWFACWFSLCMQAASDIFEDMPHELVESVTEER